MNDDQRAAYEGILEWAANPGKTWAAALEGPGGTGKTYTLAAVIRTLLERGVPIGFAAPTHKAKKAGLDALKREKVDPTRLAWFGTVSAAIGRRPHESTAPEETSGRARFAVSGIGPAELNRVRVLLVDEVSMIDEGDIRALKEISSGIGCCVLFVGDFAQLRPVAGRSVETLFSTALRRRWKLDRIERVREGRGAITHLANRFRTDLHFDVREYAEPGVVEVYDSFRAWQREYLAEPDMVAVAYRNSVVDALSDLKRTSLMGTDVRPFEDLETILVSKQPLAYPESRDSFAHISDTLVVVENLGPEVVRVPWADCEVQATHLDLMNESGARMLAPTVLARDEQARLTPLMDACRKIPLELADVRARRGPGYVTLDQGDVSPATWTWLQSCDDLMYGDRMRTDRFGRVCSRAWAEAYYGVLRRFAIVQHPYALTAHKVQGSTLRAVAVHLPDIRCIVGEDDRRAAAYVAVSRASERVVILK